MAASFTTLFIWLNYWLTFLWLLHIVFQPKWQIHHVSVTQVCWLMASVTICVRWVLMDVAKSNLWPLVTTSLHFQMPKLPSLLVKKKMPSATITDSPLLLKYLLLSSTGMKTYSPVSSAHMLGNIPPCCLAQGISTVSLFIRLSANLQPNFFCQPEYIIIFKFPVWNGLRYTEKNKERICNMPTHTCLGNSVFITCLMHVVKINVHNR